MPLLSNSQLDALARIAADAVVLAVRWSPGEPGPLAPKDDTLTAWGASFVTLRQGATVRGCVGSLSAIRGLHQDVDNNARAAALRDSRFEPLLPVELSKTHVEVAVLTAPTPLSFTDERDLHLQLRPGVDGLVVAHGTRLATYLPEVWDEYPEPARFVEELRSKAGIEQAFLASELQFQRFTAQRSAPVSLDREVSPRRDLRAVGVRWRWRARQRAKQLRRVTARLASIGSS